MKNIELINRLSQKNDELTQIIEHIKTNNEDSQLYIDLCLNKLREMYEVLLITPQIQENFQVEETKEDLPAYNINHEVTEAQEDMEVEDETGEANKSLEDDFQELPEEISEAFENKDPELEESPMIQVNDDVYKEEEEFPEDIFHKPDDIENSTESNLIIESEQVLDSEESKTDIEVTISQPEDEIPQTVVTDIFATEISSEEPEQESEEDEIPATSQANEPTLFGNDLQSEQQEITEEHIEDDIEAEPDIEALMEDINSQTESIGEKYIDQNKKSLNDLLANIKQKKDLATQMQYQKIEDLKTVITLNDKIRFIKELFNSDNNVYTNFIDAINNCSDLDEAMAIINENIVWDDSKDSFKEFLELVYRRHLPESN